MTKMGSSIRSTTTVSNRCQIRKNCNCYGIYGSYRIVFVQLGYWVWNAHQADVLRAFVKCRVLHFMIFYNH